MPTVLLADLGGSEVLIILAVIVLLFGAKKLPDLARGGGQALRIFKAETSGLLEDDQASDRRTASDAERELEAKRAEVERARQRVREEQESRGSGS